jgi:hypothetical protein
MRARYSGLLPSAPSGPAHKVRCSKSLPAIWSTTRTPLRNRSQVLVTRYQVLIATGDQGAQDYVRFLFDAIIACYSAA